MRSAVTQFTKDWQKSQNDGFRAPVSAEKIREVSDIYPRPKKMWTTWLLQNLTRKSEVISVGKSGIRTCGFCVQRDLWRKQWYHKFNKLISCWKPSKWSSVVVEILGHGWAVATHFEKITHFEKKFQSALNLGPKQRTLNFFFQSVLNLRPT